ncbi:MAG: hypothetical protein WBL24_02460, partial [Kiritimatiellia bacterium]
MLNLLPTPQTLRLESGALTLPPAPAIRTPPATDPRITKTLHELFPALLHIATRLPAPDILLETTPAPPESYQLRIT